MAQEAEAATNAASIRGGVDKDPEGARRAGGMSAALVDGQAALARAAEVLQDANEEGKRGVGGVGSIA